MQLEIDNRVYQVALFKLKDRWNEKFLRLNENSLDHLSTFDGHLGSETYRSIIDGQIYLDLVLWESLDHAVMGWEKFEVDPNVHDYLGAIDTLKFFDHVKAIEQNACLKFHELERDDILEFAAVQLKKEAISPFLANREPLMKFIGHEFDAFKEVKTVQSVYDPHSVIDLARWDDVASCEQALKKLEDHVLFQQYASSFDMEHELLMGFFERVR